MRHKTQQLGFQCAGTGQGLGTDDVMADIQGGALSLTLELKLKLLRVKTFSFLRERNIEIGRAIFLQKTNTKKICWKRSNSSQLYTINRKTFNTEENMYQDGNTPYQEIMIQRFLL